MLKIEKNEENSKWAQVLSVTICFYAIPMKNASNPREAKEFGCPYYFYALGMLPESVCFSSRLSSVVSKKIINRIM